MDRLRLASGLAILATVVAILGYAAPASAQEKPENRINLAAAIELPVGLPLADRSLRWGIEAPAVARSMTPRGDFYDLRVADRLHRDAARLPSVVDRPDEGLGLADSVLYDVVRLDAERALSGATRSAVRNYLLQVSGVEALRQAWFGSGGGAGAAAARGGMRPHYDLRLSSDAATVRVGLRGERSRLYLDLGSDGALGLAWGKSDRFRRSSVELDYEPDDDALRVGCRFGF